MRISKYQLRPLFNIRFLVFFVFFNSNKLKCMIPKYDSKYLNLNRVNVIFMLDIFAKFLLSRVKRHLSFSVWFIQYEWHFIKNAWDRERDIILYSYVRNSKRKQQLLEYMCHRKPHTYSGFDEIYCVRAIFLFSREDRNDVTAIIFCI